MNRYETRSSIVSKNEAEDLTEMIFKRARERAEAIEKNVQEDYTTSTQYDVMDLARYSFVAKKNPFSQIANSKNEETVAENKEKENVQIGFPERKKEPLSSYVKNNIGDNEQLIQQEVQQAMLDARVDLSSKKTFTGALDFLNSQASIALVNKRTRAFDAIA